MVCVAQLFSPASQLPTAIAMAAPSRRLLRRLLCHEIAPCCRTHHTEASPGPPEAIYGRDLTRDDHAVFPMGSDTTVMVEIVRL